MKEFKWSDLGAGKYCSVYVDFPNDLKEVPLWHHKAGLQQTQSGYGSKLATRWKIHFEGKLWRIYATCFSNAVSHWFTVKGRTIYVN